MAEYDVQKITLLPVAGTITDNDMILIVQGGKAKRALPSAMKGKKGDPGLGVFLGITETYIVWKQGANGSWNNLFEIERLRGPRGEKPIFRKLNGTLMMKYEGEPDTMWVNIFDREELKMKFSDLTPAERDLLKLHFSDLTVTDKAELMKPATDAATDARAEITNMRQLEATVEEQEALRENSNTQWQAAEQARQNAELARNTEFERIKTDAGSATDNANEKAGLADTAASNANAATGDAITATGNANTATGNANTQADRAKQHADNPPKMGENGNWYKWSEAKKAYEDTGILAKGGVLYPVFSIKPETMELEMYYQDEVAADMFAIDENGNLTFNPK